MTTPTTWAIGNITVQRVLYFDTPLPAEAVGVSDAGLTAEWAEPWLTDGQPTIGQAFWVIRSGDGTAVVDPCGASDPFLRSGPEAVDHQNAAFAFLEAAGCPAESVDTVVFTHLDGIGMAVLVDGASAGEETWTPAFPNAEVLISGPEYVDITTSDDPPMGAEAFLALDAAGVVRTVDAPHEVMAGVTMRFTGCHSPGHCVIDIADGDARAIMVGHLTVSPLSAVGEAPLHNDSPAAWIQLRAELDAAAADGAIVMGSLWPSPGAATVSMGSPYVLTPFG